MSERPDPSPTEFSCNLFSRTVMEKICSALKGSTDLEVQIHLIQDVVAQEIPYVRDTYSQLRYARAILEVLLPEISEPFQPEVDHPIWISELCELGFLGLLRQGADAGTLMGECRGLLDLAALCRGILRSPTIPPLQGLLDLAGRSAHLDSLIRDLLRGKLPLLDTNAVALELGQRTRAEEPGSERWTLYIDLLAENRIAAFDPAELEELLQRCGADPQKLLVVLRMIGDCGYEACLPQIHRLLTRGSGDSPRTVLSCLDVLEQIGNRESLRIIETFCGRGLPRQCSEYAGLLRQYAEAVGQDIRVRLEGRVRRRRGGPVMVQTVLNGNRQNGGLASVGGVLTFLHSIGDALGVEGSLEGVVTLEVLPWNVADPSSPLVSAGRGRHSILRVPVYSLPNSDPEQLMIHELGIRRSVELALRMRGIAPDLIHIRYTDNLAKAMMVLSGEIGSRLIFTVTADPHRDFSDSVGRMLPMSEEQALFNLNKVFIADSILEKAAGILGIAHGSADAQLLPYFPKLCLSPEIQRKPVRVIPEGIRLDAAEETGGKEQLLSMLTDHPGRFTLDHRNMDRPVILNVGRLVAAKGQQRLLEAWAESPLNEEYNLILIGGNLNAPSSEEAEMLGGIERTMERHPRLAGRFCHLSALDNSLIRRLESALVENGPNHVQVYLCSSLKEEFGISILEAMAAGYLVLAPIRGGVSTYLEHGKGGFLIDTASALSIRRAAEQILLSEPPERLQRIAEEGRRFILDNFGIEKIAERFAGFYHHVLEHPGFPESMSAHPGVEKVRPKRLPIGEDH